MVDLATDATLLNNVTVRKDMTKFSVGNGELRGKDVTISTPQEEKVVNSEITAANIRASMAKLWEHLEAKTCQIHQKARFLADGGSSDALLYLDELWRIRAHMLTSLKRQQVDFLSLDQIIVSLRRMQGKASPDDNKGPVVNEAIVTEADPAASLTPSASGK